MCFMGGSQHERRVGVRELRRNLSVYLRRVERGERLEITEHGRLIAVLAPTGEPAGAATGRVPPVGSLLEIFPPRGRPSTRLSEALEEERAERR